MCGIAGILGPDDGLDSEALLLALRHRGPDRRAAVRPSPGVWLGATRLAINDLSPAGDQPMSTADGALTVVYNGEIYNAHTLRDTLTARGCVFRSRCDTEVLLHGYREWGDELVDHLEGMFAFALWDAPRRRALLARDPLGIKPLWLARRGATLVFASEVRALLAAHAADPSLSQTALASYLADGCVAEPQAIVRAVTSLAPGHRMVVADGTEQPAIRYWRAPAVADAGQLRGRLEEAVAGCLEADVPVGLLLSGGIDSAALGFLARNRGSVETFHVRIGSAGASRAQALARELGTRHHEVDVDAAEVERAAVACLAAQDQPSVDGLNTFLVAGAIHRAGLKAAISGVGADELFLGYPLHRTFLRARAWQAEGGAPAAAVRHAATLAARLPWPTWRLEKVVALAAADGAAQTYAAARALFPPAACRRLLPDAPPPPVGDDESDVSRLELSHYLLNTLLRDADVMSMAHGVELRVPLLNRGVVETVLPLSNALKLRGGVNKPLWIDAVPELPDWVTRARKEGFDLPFERWLLGPLRAPVEATLLSPRAATNLGLDPRAVERVWNRFVRWRDRSSAHRVWALHSLFCWAQAHNVSA